MPCIKIELYHWGLCRSSGYELDVRRPRTRFQYSGFKAVRNGYTADCFYSEDPAKIGFDLDLNYDLYGQDGTNSICTGCDNAGCIGAEDTVSLYTVHAGVSSISTDGFMPELAPTSFPTTIDMTFPVTVPTSSGIKTVAFLGCANFSQALTNSAYWSNAAGSYQPTDNLVRSCMEAKPHSAMFGLQLEGGTAIKCGATGNWPLTFSIKCRNPEKSTDDCMCDGINCYGTNGSVAFYQNS